MSGTSQNHAVPILRRGDAVGRRKKKFLEEKPEAEDSSFRSTFGWIPLWCGRCLRRAPITRWNSSAGRTWRSSTKSTLERANVGTVKRLFDARTLFLRITAYLQWPTESKLVETAARRRYYMYSCINSSCEENHILALESAGIWTSDSACL